MEKNIPNSWLVFPDEIWIMILDNLDISLVSSLALSKRIHYHILYKLTSLTVREPSRTNLFKKSFLDDQLLKRFQLLTYLKLPMNHNITDEAIQSLENLTNLDIEANKSLTSKAIQNLTKLRTLNLKSNRSFYPRQVGDEGIYLYEIKLFNI
jgi:hypothetical protein